MLFACYTHKGNVREINEDSIYIPIQGQHTQTPFFLAVADGMGGHNAGEVASAVAIRSMVNLLNEERNGGKIETDAVNVLRHAMIETNNKVCLLGRQSSAFSGMGTTLTATLCFEDNLIIAHLGDSRAYLVHQDGSYLRVTHDHTLVQEFVDHKVLTPEQAAVDPRRNILTRALGTELNQIPDLFELSWQQGDKLVLCSDGLTAYLGDPELCAYVKAAIDIEACAKELGELALHRGGIDNISVCLAFHLGGQTS